MNKNETKRLLKIVGILLFFVILILIFNKIFGIK